MIKFINNSRLKIKNIMESMYIPINETWGWFVDLDTISADTDTDTDTVGVTDINQILSINSYKSINNLNNYDNPKLNNKCKSNDKFTNDNESIMGLCIVETIFIIITCTLFILLLNC